MLILTLLLALGLIQAVPRSEMSAFYQGNQTIPTDSAPQNLPCSDQPTSFNEFLESFATGRLPSPSEVTGSWALIGLWVHKDSRPSLNCDGITRGPKLGWTLVANGYSVGLDAIGTNHQETTFKADRRSVTFSVDFGGDYSPSFRCSLTRRDTLACLGSPYYDAVEFKKLVPKPIYSELPTYPELARYARLVGQVKLWFIVDESGAVSQAGVVSGHPIFGDAALSTVKSWKFHPGIMQTDFRYETNFVYELRTQAELGEPKLTVSMTDFRRVEVISEHYTPTIQ